MKSITRWGSNNKTNTDRIETNAKAAKTRKKHDPAVEKRAKNTEIYVTLIWSKKKESYLIEILRSDTREIEGTNEGEEEEREEDP